jgi:hypothetical protein
MSLNPFSGYANGVPYSPAGNTVTEAFDTNSGAQWFNNGKSGWKPGSAQFDVDNQLVITAELTTYVVTAPATGLYKVSGLVVSTSTDSGTLPAVTVTYTDADSATAESVTLLTSTTNSVPGTQKSAEAIINVKAGGTITFTGTSWATSTYSAKLRTEYLG